MTDGVNIAFLPAVARVPRRRDAPQADHGRASFRGKISFTIGALCWSRAPRHSPNFMDWKMGASLSLIPELEEVVQHGSRQKRVETLQRITALFLDGARSYNDQHVGLFDDVFGILIEEIEAKARAELANRLAPVGNAPVNVLRRLAQDDDIAVAGPVLKLASRLPEDDLVGVARTKSQAHLQAISACPTLSEAVTDELVRRGDREVALRIADNRGARILRRYAERKTADLFPEHLADVDLGNSSTYELLQQLEDSLLALKPADLRDQWWLGQAMTLAAKIGDTGWLLAQQVGQGTPKAFVALLVFWLTLLFASFGLFAPRNFTSAIILTLCALAVGGAIGMLLELEKGFGGLVHNSPQPMLQAVKALEARPSE